VFSYLEIKLPFPTTTSLVIKYLHFLLHFINFLTLSAIKGYSNKINGKTLGKYLKCLFCTHFKNNAEGSAHTHATGAILNQLHYLRFESHYADEN
jgi:hypothetical protein